MQAFTVPALTTPVVDQVGLLTAQQKLELENLAHNFRDQHKAQIQILIVQDLQGETIESAAIQIFDKWKLGDAVRDDGILMLFAIGEKKMRIEVGQGLEGAVPDVIAKRIISDIMRPYFQRSEFFTGIKFGSLAIQSAITGDAQQELNPNKDRTIEKKKNRGGSLNIFVIGIIFFIWLIIFMISPSTGINILLAVLSSRGGRSSSYGGGGSRGWGGGGGSSSGGGASGGW